MLQAESAVEIAALLAGRRYVDAEFMYRPRPETGREQIIFDFTLRSRLAQLEATGAVLFICNSHDTIDSLIPFQSEFPTLLMMSCITNPLPYNQPQRHREQRESSSTPHQFRWEQPDHWQRMQTTDRWARIEMALRVGEQMQSDGYVVMPAHDAVWGNGLLPRLRRLSQHWGEKGLPAAVSPYTYHQHSAVPGAGIPQDVIALLNTALSRDVLFPIKIRLDRVQAFWGKMSLAPFGMCKTILEQVDMGIWEDDLEIERVIREQGYAVRCQWIHDAQMYRQALPVFDRAGVHRVIERTLHYSLHIPGEPVGGSKLYAPLDLAGRLRKVISPRFRLYNPQAEALIAECATEIAARIHEFGASWLDWGGYRHVVRVGYPAVEVWKRGEAKQERILS